MPSVAQEDAAQHVRWHLGNFTDLHRLGWSGYWFHSLFQLVSTHFRKLGKLVFWRPKAFGILWRSWQDIGVQHHCRCGSSLGGEIHRRAVSFIRFIAMISMRSMTIYATIALGTSHLYQYIHVLNKSSPYQWHPMTVVSVTGKSPWALPQIAELRCHRRHPEIAPSCCSFLQNLVTSVPAQNRLPLVQLKPLLV